VVTPHVADEQARYVSGLDSAARDHVAVLSQTVYDYHDVRTAFGFR
jgi:hypothetical protein